jgi:hypothetical protein
MRLLAHSGGAGDAQVWRLREGGDVHLLELGDIERLGLGLAGELGYFLGAASAPERDHDRLP